MVKGLSGLIPGPRDTFNSCSCSRAKRDNQKMRSTPESVAVAGSQHPKSIPVPPPILRERAAIPP